MDASRPKKAVKLYQKSDIIFEEDSTGEEMYILRSGKVKLVLKDEKGEAEVSTVEKVELEVLDRGDFLRTIREHPEFALNIMHELSQRVRRGNILYLEVIERAMAPFCRRNCLGKTMDAFTRQAMSRLSQKPGEKATAMGNWKCTACDYVYVPEFGDPQGRVSPRTIFENLPDSWTCPECGGPKSVFERIES